MFNNTKILEAFAGCVGWHQNDDPNGVELVETGGIDLTASSSGLYFNDEHPRLDFIELLSIAPNYNLNQTSTNAAFSAWLKKRTEAGIIRALTSWYHKKLNQNTGNGLIERDYLHASAGSISNTDLNTGDRVFYQITSQRSKSLKTNVPKVGFQFTGVENFTARIFEDGKSEAIATQAIDYTTAGDLMWFDFTDFEMEGGKTYFLSYDQADITSQSINAVQQSYPGISRTALKFPRSKYLNTYSGRTKQSGTTLWDTSTHEYSVYTNYGMNLEYSIECDYTNFFIENKKDFAPLISLSVAISMIHRITFNPQSNSNRNTNNIPIEIMIRELDGESQGRPTGLIHRYNQALDALQFDKNQIDKVCLKCKRKGISISVG